MLILDEFPTGGREFIMALRRPAGLTDGLELFFYFQNGFKI
jgi:hypothetical protein